MKNKKIINKNAYSTVENKSEDIKSACECGSRDFIFDYELREEVCKHCGLVFENRMDPSADKPVYDLNPENSTSRVGAPVSEAIHDWGLSTVISDKNIYGSSDKKAQWARMKKEDARSKISNNHDRNLVTALQFLSTTVSRLNFSRNLANFLRKSSAKIYRRALGKNLIQGRSIEGIVAASLYISCRQSRLPNTLDEISNVSGIDKSSLSKYYRLLCKELNIKLQHIHAEDFVPKIRTNLEVSLYVEAKAIELIKFINDSGFNGGNNPVGIAAAAIYVACQNLGIKRSQKKVAIAADVSEVTVRKNAKIFNQYLADDFFQDFASY